jgi:uncharacterized small protein (DUF1192 family)
MQEFHKEMLDTIIKDWDLTKVETYIAELEERRALLDQWIRHLKDTRRKKMRKPAFDTGDRSGT